MYEGPISKDKAAFEKGWVRWCRLHAEEDCASPDELIGFRFAAAVNEDGWGDRPEASEAEDGWDTHHGECNIPCCAGCPAY